jgi:hypothetical protein
VELLRIPNSRLRQGSGEALVVAALLTAATSGAAQSPSRDELIERVADYVQRFIDVFSNVVAEEDYAQQYRGSRERRRLKSDFLLVAYPGNTTRVITFRDVLDVDGKPVGGKDERMTRLFMQPFDDALRRAREIQIDGSRRSLGETVLADPLAVLVVLQRFYQKEFRITVGGRATQLGPDVRELTVVRVTAPGPRGFRARAWVAETSGEVVKTELSYQRLTTTTFRWDPGFRIHIPAEMNDEHTVRSGTVLGTATYGNFRRFQVRTETAVAAPNP